MSNLIRPDHDFMAVVQLIESARQRASRAVNTELIDLYWAVGEYVSQKLSTDAWGKGTVEALADYIQQQQPGLRGFSAKNIWRMRQFYEAYRETPILSTLLRELPWSAHLHVLTRSKYPEEREFYLRTATEQRWSVREVARQMDNQLFARTITEPVKMAKALREAQPQVGNHFKDSYYLEFLGLPQEHAEADLHRALMQHLRRFLTELGRDFCFVGSEFPLQVGGQDFALDLLFFHRGLNCLVAIELKVDRFEPEHLGKLNFYLEALDRDHKKPHENPTIGLLLCASKDDEVVEYALSRSLSPALVAQYQTQLPDKKLLQAKLHEFYLANLGAGEVE
ncbi:PDDEXK nuclease domain-containing protein [Propionivibrio sp.]|uniref:PDDEXK nuclease domain-containing protein n=1 Tax=Propionivibrio sp. TaxID=2212460 RepID=UPI00272EC58F|nr:PDDEXK nuclease domain-containing protein [Propionivibrio sp.]